MRVLGLWLGCAVALGTGYVWGWYGIWPVRGEDLGIWAGRSAAGIAAVVALLAVFLTLVRHVRRPVVLRWLAAAGLGLAGARGVLAGVADRQVQWPPSAAEGFLTLQIQGASVPGSRCRVVAREPQTGVGLWLSLPQRDCLFAHGDLIAVEASSLQVETHPAYPGGSDPRRLAAARGADLVASAPAAWTIRAGNSGYWRWVSAVRHDAWQGSRGNRGLAFVAGSTLGVRTAIAFEHRQRLRRAGLGHLIAVSGIHIGIAAWFVQLVMVRLAALLGRSIHWAVFAAWVPVIGFVGLTGAGAPAVRAAVMFMVAGLARARGRPAHGLALLAMSLAMMLAVRPAWALDPGFHLSAAAMAALVRAPTGLGLVGQSWRVTWAILPPSLWHFGQVGAIAIVMNLVAIPVFTIWVLPWGLVGWAMRPWLGTAGLGPSTWGAQLIIDVADLVSSWPTVPPGVIAGLAVIGLVARAKGLSQTRWRNFAPPLLACVGALVVLAVRSGGHRRVGSWVALGGSGSIATLAADPRGACIRDPQVVRRWPEVLDAVGVDHVSRLEVSRPGGGLPDPALEAVRRSLTEHGRWTVAGHVCVLPAQEAVRAAVDACRAEFDARRVAVAGDHVAGARMCFAHGRWRTFSIPPADGQPR